MTSLFEGWLQLYNGHPYDAPPIADSPQREPEVRLYVYDSYAPLGPISAADFLKAEVRLSPSDSRIDRKLLHVHGRFCVVTHADRYPFLQMEIKRFVVMENMNPLGDDIPGELCSSVIVQGHVVPHGGALNNTADGFFMLEVSECIRDSTQTYSILCRLDATTSHLRDDTSPPSVGYIVLVSGFLESDTKHALRINVESIYLVSTRSGETFASSSQAHEELTFSGKPNIISEGDNTSANQASSSQPIVVQAKPNLKPLSMHPIPKLPVVAEAEADPSTSAPASNTRAAKRRRAAAEGQTSTEGKTSTEVTTVEEGNDSPISRPKRRRVASKNV